MPLGTLVVFSDADQLVVPDAWVQAPLSTLYSTFVTATLSLAVPEMGIEPDTVVPSSGDRSVTLGGTDSNTGSTIFRTRMAEMRALVSNAVVTPVKSILSWPLDTLLVNVRTLALFAPPAAAKISKLLSTCWPWMETLKSRWPTAVQRVSAL